MTIAIVNCFDVCDEPDQWPTSTVLYSGPFNPQFNASTPQKNHFQDFVLDISQAVSPGEAVISVAHEMIAVNVSYCALLR